VSPHFGISRLGLMSLPFGDALQPHGAKPERRRPVRQFKDLRVCIARLQALLTRSDIGPEQRKYVEAAIEQLRRLRRKADAKGPEVYKCVREIAENLVAAFMD
jgi:hypothetical protein